MKTVKLGSFGDVSRLTLGGGGIGELWGETNRAEAIATVKLALDKGITLLDTAPMYRNCEAVIAETFGGKLPAGVRITTKCQLGSPSPAEIEQRLAQSLEASLKAMRFARVDLFFLHSNICEDAYVYARRPEQQDQFATRWSLYSECVVPALEKLKAQGKIGAWGITGTGVPRTIRKALQHDTKPTAVQAVANLLDSAGGMKSYAEPSEPRTIIKTAVENGVGVLGIRVVQAGALTNAIDRTMKDSHPEVRDYVRAEPFRALCAELGEDPAAIAHRYAMSMPGVDTIILGVKNRAELEQCIAAEARGPLEPALMARVDALGLRGD